ncbi:MAG: magnesium chelatase domain-containing protein, partial [Clostridiaceae bacterium]
MVRKKLMWYTGASYHITSRGNHRNDIFRDGEDYLVYLTINIVFDAAIKEAKERLEAAIVHTRYEFPKMKIVINLSPSDIKKSGSHFDLGMAIGLLMQSNQSIFEDLSSYGFIGELSLN